MTKRRMKQKRRKMERVPPSQKTVSLQDCIFTGCVNMWHITSKLQLVVFNGNKPILSVST